VVSVEEGWPQCGIGSEISALVMEGAFNDLDAPVLRITGAELPMPYAANLEVNALPHVKDVVSQVRDLVKQ
jgi:pyruvate dehydrogenase E1 component beta subunit